MRTIGGGLRGGLLRRAICRLPRREKRRRETEKEAKKGTIDGVWAEGKTGEDRGTHVLRDQARVVRVLGQVLRTDRHANGHTSVNPTHSKTKRKSHSAAILTVSALGRVKKRKKRTRRKIRTQSARAAVSFPASDPLLHSSRNAGMAPSGASSSGLMSPFAKRLQRAD